MPKFKPGDLVAIRNRHVGGEVTATDGRRVAVKIAVIDPYRITKKVCIHTETLDEDCLEPITQKKGVITL